MDGLLQQLTQTQDAVLQTGTKLPWHQVKFQIWPLSAGWNKDYIK